MRIVKLCPKAMCLISVEIASHKIVTKLQIVSNVLLPDYCSVQRLPQCYQELASHDKGIFVQTMQLSLMGEGGHAPTFPKEKQVLFPDHHSHF